MREILFRGKDKYKGSWVKGFYYIKRSRYAGDKTFISEKHIITTGIEETSGAYGENTEYIECNVIPETVGQYTGLTDKNGKKIFEGDIFKGKVIEGKLVNYVFWYDEEERGFVYGSSYKKGYRMSIASYALSVKEFEVIGNIHDNPELLKGGEG